uniref:Repressor of RNA polymerase III transcription MAF1 homolog n=1 Tax=Panagrellus redivivus TaxID=6233 RepID=A0A7E4ZUT8_PANRE
MKLLDNAQLSEISNKIAENATDCQLDFILESYSCKMVSTDKKSWRAKGVEIPEATVDTNVLPLSNSLNVTTFNHSNGKRSRHFSERSLSGSDNDTDENMSHLAKIISRKTLFNLNQALNVTYNDYEFTGKTNASYEMVMGFQKVKDLTDKFFSPVVDGYGRMQFDLWNIVEDAIKPNECAIYSYRSSSETDPFNEDGVLWSFNFLMYNKQLKRILILACRALSTQSSDEDMDVVEWDE